MRSANPLIVALDLPSLNEAKAVAESVGDRAGMFKVGLELFAAHGPQSVRSISGPIMLDLKLHDIPTTVGRAVASLRPLAPSLLTVHTLGGRAVLEAANESKGEIGTLGVTVLTHHDDASLEEIGLPPAVEAVPLLARLAFEAGCDGVVCAPADLAAVRAACPRPFVVVTPGIRPAGVDRDEQTRAMTPREAMEAGADYLVVGRPITRAADPRAAAEAILKEIDA